MLLDGGFKGPEKEGECTVVSYDVLLVKGPEKFAGTLMFLDLLRLKDSDNALASWLLHCVGPVFPVPDDAFASPPRVPEGM